MKCPVLTEKKDFLELFEEMIDYLVAYNEDSYTDDILCDMVQDPDKRQEAFDLLMEWLSDGYETSPARDLETRPVDFSDIPAIRECQTFWDSMLIASEELIKNRKS